MRSLALLVSTAWLLPLAVAQETSFDLDQVSEILAEGTIDVDMLELRPTARHAELLARFQAAIRSDPAWWQDFAKKVPAGEPLPYDPKLGLTREEHAELIELSGDMPMVSVGASRLMIRILESRRHEITAGPELPGFGRVVVDLDADCVETEHGTARGGHPIQASAGQKPSPWNGYGWKAFLGVPDRVLAGQRGTDIRFYLGRLVDSNKPLLYYNVRAFEGGQKTVSTTIVVVLQR